ncbi:hypothetical protein AFL94_05095 [Arthrobacter sp. LS16]|nr:hypothetical protein AFL94_05095 [Arthrobacter sp. LS16]
MNFYAITYTYSPATSDARDRVRPTHVEFLQQRFENCELRVSGPVDSGAGALLVIGAESEQAALALMDQDPFAREGLIEQREIRRWDVFFGKDKL